ASGALQAGSRRQGGAVMADNVRFGGQQPGLKLVGRAGIEPATIGLKGRSTSLSSQSLSSSIWRTIPYFRPSSASFPTKLADKYASASLASMSNHSPCWRADEKWA